MRTKPGPCFSEGARLLGEAMEKLKLNQVEVQARLLGRGGKPLSNGQVDGWLYGDSRPGLTSATQLHEQFGIPPGAWLEKPKKKFAYPTLRSASSAA